MKLYKEDTYPEQTTIRLPADLKEALQEQANKMGISFNAYMLMILNDARTKNLLQQQ